MDKKCEWCENGLCTYFRTEEQQYDDEQEGIPKDICKHFYKNYKELEDYEICELLDELIDIALYTK